MQRTGVGGPGSGEGAGPGSSNAAAEDANRQAMEEQRRLMLKQVLTPEASERLGNIRLVKPEKARQLEDSVLMAARQGRIDAPLTEEQLKAMLNQFHTMNEKKTTVTISRRKVDFDEEEDEDF